MSRLSLALCVLLAAPSAAQAPRITPAGDPSVKSDTIFGQQVFIDYDAWQLLGMDPVPGTDWSISSDYLSEREESAQADPSPDVFVLPA